MHLVQATLMSRACDQDALAAQLVGTCKMLYVKFVTANTTSTISSSRYETFCRRCLFVQTQLHSFSQLCCHSPCGILQTSGVADPQKIAEDLEVAGVHLDMIVTVVDAEALDAILDLHVARKQLVIADLVLINKCEPHPTLCSLVSTNW